MHRKALKVCILPRRMVPRREETMARTIRDFIFLIFT